MPDLSSITGRRFDTGTPATVRVREGHIAAIEPADVEASTLPWLAPGLVDLQVNGYEGTDFNDSELTPDDVARISLAMDRDGLAAYCATVTTHAFEVLAHSLSTLAAAVEGIPEVAQRIAGFHLEGPYISSQDGPRGAHPLAHCRPPDWDEFRRLQEVAGGRIAILTMSPEFDGAPDFIRRVAESGVLVAIGHTAASTDQIRAAVDAGARLSTHLGNAAHGMIRRHPNYIWDQLAEDRLSASLIADGHHLPASVVKCMVRAKGTQRCVLVSDITGLGGMPAGRYSRKGLGDVEVLEDGRLVIAGQRQLLAGAALPLHVGVANVMRFAQLDLATAIAMATNQPAELIGHEGGRLEVGAPANLILFELDPAASSMHIRATFSRGEQVAGAANRGR